MMIKRKVLEGSLLIGFIGYLDNACMFDEMNIWEMSANGVLPNIVIYSKFIDVCSKLGMIDDALHFYEEIQSDKVCYNTLLSIDVNIEKHEKIARMCCEMENVEFWFDVVMACIGVWNAFWMIVSKRKLGIHPLMRSSVEGPIALIAKSLVTDSSDEDKHILLQCLAISLARRAPTLFNADVFRCLCIALLDVIFPIMCLYRGALKVQVEGSKIAQRLESILFQEASSITGVFCYRYALADEKSRVLMKSDMWKNLN